MEGQVRPPPSPEMSEDEIEELLLKGEVDLAGQSLPSSIEIF
jgi:hypothetical protein